MTRRRLLRLGLLLALSPSLAPAGRPVDPAGEVALDGDGTGWMVRATLNGAAQGLFLLDTGASYCVVSRDFSDRLRLAPRDQVDLQTANGTVRAPLVHLRTVQIGATRATDVAAVVHEAVAPPLDGIIGLNFLNQFHYAIDPRRRTLSLR